MIRRQFIESLKLNHFQQEEDIKMKGNEFQYHFPHQDDDDDGYLH